MGPDNFIMAEGYLGIGTFHIAQTGEVKALCGAPLLQAVKALPMVGWGFRGENHERYCEQCSTLHDRLRRDQ